MTIDTPKSTDVPSLRTLWKETFGDTDDFLNLFFSGAFSPMCSLCARTDNQIVGMLYWFDCIYEGEKIAYLYAVATHKSYRGRGICHALMDAVHLLLKERTYTGVILVPAEEHLFDFYARMGYAVSSYNKTLECRAEENTLEMRPISATEYAAQRSAFLPPHSVLQEGENLALLQSVASFWSGDGFLLATRKDGDELFALELLGNITLAPRITRTLGFETGTFRTVGKDAPFAMFRRLNGSSLPPPAYFAFAFD